MRKTKVSLIAIMVAAKVIVRLYPVLNKQVTGLRESGMEDLYKDADAVVLHNEDVAKKAGASIVFLDKLVDGVLSYLERDLARRRKR